MLMGSCLSVFVRNDGSPALSFVGMCAGAAANILLDWLFIFPLQTGVVGAAIASGLGQVLTMLILLTHFLRQKGNLRIQRLRPNGALIRKVCRRGVPEAATQLTTPVTALCYNLMLARLISDIGVSAFSVLSFIYSLANAIAVCRGIVVKALMIFCLPLAFGTEAIWMAPFATEIITLAAAIVLGRASKLVYR